MKHSRREFIKISSLASASLMVPQFLKSASGRMGIRKSNGKILVVIQLAGGNDGLNCVVPFRNDLYYKNRAAIHIPDNELIQISDDAALNHNLSGIAELFDAGNLCIINSVGYPNPNRSHFRSMDIWQSASDENQYVQTGWIGRMLDANCHSHQCHPHQAVEIDDTLSLALKGEQLKGMAFRNPQMLKKTASTPLINSTGKNYEADAADKSYLEFLYKTLAETTQSADYIYAKSKIYHSKIQYPQNDFGKKIKLIAELIISGAETSVYYVSLPGFDTHVFQKGTHARLLKSYSDSLKAMCDDLKSNNRFHDVMILTFSEFGRRVKENSGKGTDHGTANNVFIAGGALKKAGLYNPLPDLTNLEEGDLKFRIDFRSVYSAVLSGWMNEDSEKILLSNFDSLDFV